MSKYLSASAIQQFDDEVKHAYQSGGQGLAETVRQRNNITGDTYNFRTMGAGLATERGPSQSDVTPMDVSHALVACSLENWVAAEYTDIFDAAEVNIDERSELAGTIANAIKRRKDQMIIDAVHAATPLATVATGASTALAVSHLTELMENFIDAGVVQDASMDGSSDLHLLISAAGIRQLLNDNKVGSSEYAQIKALIHGEINYFMGFNFHPVGTRTEGGLSKAGDIRTCLAYHKNAAGIAIGIDMHTTVDWISQKRSWLSACDYKGGAVAVDANGIQKLTIDETA